MNFAEGQQRATRSPTVERGISSPRMGQDACNVTNSRDSFQQFNWEGRVSGAHSAADYVLRVICRYRIPLIA